MIVFDLKCSHNHTFEGWFRSSDAYDEQQACNLISCPACGSSDIGKAIMAPNITAKGNQKADQAKKPKARPISISEIGIAMENREELSAAIAPDLPQDLQDQMEELFAKVQKHVEENCTYVGADFSNEARKIHYGESDSTSIYGEASEDETLELIEEGIDILPLPIRRKNDA